MSACTVPTRPQLSVDKILGNKAFDPVEYVDGLENPADFPNIARWLVKQGYTDADIAKVIGGNVLRVSETGLGALNGKAEAQDR